MSVLVKGMKMPDSCYHCKIAESCGHYIANYTDRRHPDCPLIALPEHHGRLVDADALRDRLRSLADDGWNKSTTTSWAEAFSECEDMVEEMPTIDPEPHWIPCSEREPEEYGEYRITWTTSASEKRFIGDSEYEVTDVWDADHYRFKGEWLLDDYVKNYPDVKVMAWKPLEEPYTEDSKCQNT